MGIFSRSNSNDNQNNDDLKNLELPTSKDLKEPVFSAPEPPISLPKARSISKNGYGIEDAIELMRGLPKDNNEVVVTVVKKTLESTNISVQDIIDDANAKETRIRNNHKTLEEEIKQLQGQIAQRNQQITELLDDLKNTTDVRQRLQLALELEQGSKSSAEVKTSAVSAPQHRDTANKNNQVATGAASMPNSGAKPAQFKPGHSPQTPSASQK